MGRLTTQCYHMNRRPISKLWSGRSLPSDSSKQPSKSDLIKSLNGWLQPRSLIGNQKRVTAAQARSLEGPSGAIAVEVCGLEDLLMNFFACPGLIPIHNSNRPPNLRRVSNFEMDGVHAVNNSGNRHDPVFKVGLQPQTLQSNVTFPIGVGADREANLKSINSMKAEILPIKSITSQRDAEPWTET